MRISALLCIVAFFFGGAVNAQEIWDLEKCLDYATNNNLIIKQYQLNVDLDEVDLRQNRLSRLPSLNFNSDAGINFGRTIDPTTNEFKNEEIIINRLSLSGNVPIYTGGQINNSIKQSEADLRASKDELEYFELLQLNAVSEAYLRVILAKEQLKVAQKALELSENQLEQTDKLISAGILPENDRLDILAQIARNRQNVVAGENTAVSAMIALKNVLNLPPDYNIDIEIPVITLPTNFNPDQYSFRAVYENSVQASPQITGSNLRLRSAELGVPIARSSTLPSLSFIGSVSSNYSDAAMRASGETFPVIQEQTVFIENQEVTIAQTFDVSVFEEVPYFDQIDNNFGQFVGLNLSVPIFNRFSGQSNIERAKLNLANTRVQNEQLLQTYRNDAQQLIADVKAAKARYEVANESMDAQRAAFDNAQKRFDLGVINTFDFTTAKNALEQAEFELLQSKFNYLYQIKRLEWTMGDYSEPIRFF